jgi:preprotein translocase subunit Sec61beta
MTIAIVRAGLVRVPLFAEGEVALGEWGTLPSRHGAEGFESSLDAAGLVRCS